MGESWLGNSSMNRLEQVLCSEVYSLCLITNSNSDYKSLYPSYQRSLTPIATTNLCILATNVHGWPDVLPSLLLLLREQLSGGDGVAALELGEAGVQGPVQVGLLLGAGHGNK